MNHFLSDTQIFLRVSKFKRKRCTIGTGTYMKYISYYELTIAMRHLSTTNKYLSPLIKFKNGLIKMACIIDIRCLSKVCLVFFCLFL